MQSVRRGMIGCGDVTEVKSGPAFRKAEGSDGDVIARKRGKTVDDMAVNLSLFATAVNARDRVPQSAGAAPAGCWLRRPAALCLIFLCLSLSCLSAASGPRAACRAPVGQPGPAIDLRTILEKAAAHRRMKAERLAIYSVERTYRVETRSVNKQATLKVSMIFVSPDVKLFEVHSWSGSGFMRRNVLNRLIEAEQQSARGDLQERVAITPDNYAFELLRVETVQGRPQYVLRVRPKRKHAFLFDGMVWVDGEDFAVTRIEGRPAKAPSFWTRKIEFVHEYAKFGAYWFPVRNTSVTTVLIFGRTTTEIEYSDYRINQPSLFERAAEIRGNQRK